MIITMAVPTAAMVAKHDMNMHEEIWKQNNLNLLKKGPKKQLSTYRVTCHKYDFTHFD